MVRLRELVAAACHRVGGPPVDHLGPLLPAGVTEANHAVVLEALSSLRSFPSIITRPGVWVGAWARRSFPFGPRISRGSPERQK